MALNRKRKKWPWVLTAMLLLAAAGAVAAFVALSQTAGSQADSRTAYAQAQTGSITTTVVGTGNVEDCLIDACIPADIAISEVLVEVGDVIEKGTAIATADADSVSTAISDATSRLDSLDGQISDIENGAVAYDYVLAKTKATVKAVYAQPGVSAADTVKEHGALMVLELAQGGELKIINSVGETYSVLVKEGYTVYDGTYLITLQVPAQTGDLEGLKAQRDEVIARLEMLNTLQYEPTLYSDAAGEVKAVVMNVGASVPSSDGGYKGVALSLVAPDTVKLSLSIDELDIMTVKQGQEVSVEMDAISGQSFFGTVTEVSTAGSVSGGIATYSAVVSFERGEGILSGMSATATIVKEKKDDVVTIPLLAVQEYGSTQYVYTSVDEQGNLGGETPIETGLSDGTNVEILSGLEPGATVYYRQSASSSSNMSLGFNMSGMSTGPGTITAGPGGGMSPGGRPQ
jgi:multidrug efflux pump subunit AcrA (membrane-fusion protein)